MERFIWLTMVIIFVDVNDNFVIRNKTVDDIAAYFCGNNCRTMVAEDKKLSLNQLHCIVIVNWQIMLILATKELNGGTVGVVDSM